MPATSLALPRRRKTSPPRQPIPRACSADLDVLHNIHSKTGFHFVEQHRPFNYRAAFCRMVKPMPGDPEVMQMRKMDRRIPRIRPRTIIGHGFKTPTEAASAAIHYFKSLYGDHWREVVASMRVKPWLAAWRPKQGGWIARVWIEGRCREVTLADVDPRHRKSRRLTIVQAREMYVWESREVAYAMIREFLHERFESKGIDARLHLWRTSGRMTTGRLPVYGAR